MASTVYRFTGKPGTFEQSALANILTQFDPAVMVMVNIGGSDAVIVTGLSLNDEAVNAAIFRAYPGVAYAAGEAAPQLMAALAIAQADVQVTADNAIAEIVAGLEEANADLLGWDGMTTTDKIAATKRMLVRHIAVLMRLRQIIKYVRYL